MLELYYTLLGSLLGAGIVLAYQEMRRISRKPRVVTPTPPAPKLTCPLPSPHFKHDQTKCAIAWYLNNQHR